MKGDVRLRIECPLPERLLKRAVQRGIRLCGVRRADPRTLLVDTDDAGARAMARLCRRYAIPCAVLSRRGGSAALAFLKRRWTLFAGMIVFAALTALFLGRIWRIDIGFTGEAAALGRAGDIVVLLRRMGVSPGVSNALDTDRIAGQLRAQAGNYSFVGVRVQGIRLLVEAAPEIPPPPLYDVDAARDLVSSREGVVVSAVARSGALCVKPGDTVRRGQLLIRGEELAGKDETRSIAALGEVVVRTWSVGSASLPLWEDRTRFTGRKSDAAWLQAPGFRVELTRGESFASQRVQTEVLPVGGLFLPVEIVREIRRETEIRRTEAARDVVEARLARLSLADAALQLALEGPEDFRISRTWIDYETEGAMLRARAVYEITTNAAVTREALLQGG